MIKYEDNVLKPACSAYAFDYYISQQSYGSLFLTGRQQPVGVRALGTKLHWNLKVILDLIHHVLVFFNLKAPNESYTYTVM